MPNAVAMIELLRTIETDHGIPVEVQCSALEEALAKAFREHEREPEALVLVGVDRETGAIEIVRRRVVSDDPEVADVSPAAIAIDRVPPGYAPGDFFDEPVDIGRFRRIAAATAREVLDARVYEHECEGIYARYRALVGTIVRGLVQRVVDRVGIVLALDYEIEGILPFDECGPNDRYGVNDFVDVEILGVQKSPHGPVIVLSRSRASYARALFEDPKPILACARRAGFVTVLASTREIDPTEVARVGAALGHERIQVIPWSHDPAEMVAHLLPPESGEVFAVAEHRLVIVESSAATPLQIELARQLTGWGVKVAEPGKSDVALEAHLAEIASLDAEPIELAPDFVAKLEAFARERDAEVA